MMFGYATTYTYTYERYSCDIQALIRYTHDKAKLAFQAFLLSLIVENYTTIYLSNWLLSRYK
jgi:hypothetical protein